MLMFPYLLEPESKIVPNI